MAANVENVTRVENVTDVENCWQQCWEIFSNFTGNNYFTSQYLTTAYSNNNSFNGNNIDNNNFSNFSNVSDNNNNNNNSNNNNNDNNDNNVIEHGRTTTSEKYGYGTLSVLIISILPIISVGIVSFHKSPKYKYVIGCMLGLCVGSLVGDSLLHLMPEVLLPGSHDHGGETTEDHDHDLSSPPPSNETTLEVGNATTPASGSTDHENEDEESDHLINVWKMTVACCSLWLFLNLQLMVGGLSKWLAERKKKKKQEWNRENTTKVYENGGFVGEEAEDNSQPEVHHHDNEDAHDTLHVHADPSVAWTLTIGDGLHNFTDGLAIGASFANSNTAGLATSIAVFCHELPHEFGDAALMLSAGWSWRKVIVLQVISQLSAFVGLYIGISLSDNFDEAQMWIFCIAAGMFLYVALADAVPEILELVNHYRSILIAFLANLGIGVGFAIMILLAAFEEKIKI